MIALKDLQETGISEDGGEKDSYMPGMELHAKYTVFSEGCRGHLGKEIIRKFELDKNCDPQHYGIGFKEIWEIDPSKHEEGLVLHSMGWPSIKNTTSGSYMYHNDNNQISIGYVVPLSYENLIYHHSIVSTMENSYPHRIISKVENELVMVHEHLLKVEHNRIENAFPIGLIIGDNQEPLTSQEQKVVTPQ